MVDKALFSSEKTNWETPQDLFDELDKEFQFDLDAAASDTNRKCMMYYTKENDGLAQPWYVPGKIETVWCNPPYGKYITPKWVRKAAEEHAKGTTVVMLLPARVDTKWFHEYIYNKENVSVRFIKGRLKFLNENKEEQDAAPFPSMVVIFRPSNARKEYLKIRNDYLEEIKSMRQEGKEPCTYCCRTGKVHEKIPTTKPNTDYDLVYHTCPRCEGKGWIPYKDKKE